MQFSRDQLLFVDNTKPSQLDLVRFITPFSDPRQELRQIVKSIGISYWRILRSANTFLKLHKLLFKKPLVWKTRWFLVILTIRSRHCDQLGTFRCNACNMCSYICETKSIMLPNGETHRSRHFTDNTSGVIYLFSCECSCFYVDKTKPCFSSEYRNMYTLFKSVIFPPL